MKIITLILGIVAIAPTNAQVNLVMNDCKEGIICKGLLNKISVVWYKESCDNIVLKAKDGIIENRSNCNYFIDPGNNKTLTIDLYKKVNGFEQFFGKYIIPVKRLPDPLAELENFSKQKYLTKQNLCGENKIVIEPKEVFVCGGR